MVLLYKRKVQKVSDKMSLLLSTVEYLRHVNVLLVVMPQLQSLKCNISFLYMVYRSG